MGGEKVMEKCCCYQCEKRSVNCHAWCEDYKAWAERNQKRLDAIGEERVRDAAFMRRYIDTRNAWLLRVQKGRYHK